MININIHFELLFKFLITVLLACEMLCKISMQQSDVQSGIVLRV